LLDFSPENIALNILGALKIGEKEVT